MTQPKATRRTSHLTITLVQLRAQLGAARIAALKDARKDWNFRCFYPRGGTVIATQDRNGQCAPHPEANAVPWHGTKVEIEATIEQVLRDYPNVTRVYLAGGFDGADSPLAYQEGDYQPQCAMWDVTVWERVEEAAA